MSSINYADISTYLNDEQFQDEMSAEIINWHLDIRKANSNA